MTCTKFNTATAVIGDTKVVGNVTYQYKGNEIWEAITAPLKHNEISNRNAIGAHDASAIDRSKITVNCIKDLTIPLVNNQSFSVTGFYSGTTVGGGEFVWDATKDKSLHNGGTIIAPEAIATWDGTQVNIATLLSWTGNGSGCWVKANSGSSISLLEFGADILLSANSNLAFSKVLSGEFGNVTLPNTPLKITKLVHGTIGGIPIYKNVNVEGSNSKVLLDSTTAFFYIGREEDYLDPTFVSFYGIAEGVDYAQVIADTTVTSNTFTVNTGNESAFSTGDLVYIRLGQAPYDSAEPEHFFYANIVSTSSGTVTIDRPIGYAMSVVSTPNTRQRRIIKVDSIPQNTSIRGLYLDGKTLAADAEAGIQIRYGRNLNIENLGGVDVGAGLVFAQFAENLTLKNISVDGSANDATQASKGRAINFAECKNVSVTDFRFKGCRRTIVAVEGACEKVVLDGGVIVNDFVGRGNDIPIVSVLGGKDFRLLNTKIEGNPCTIFRSITNDKLMPPFIKDVEVSNGFAPAWDTIPKYLHVRDIESNVKLGAAFNFQSKQTFTCEINMLGGATSLREVALPLGVYTKITVMCTNKTRLTQLFFSRSDLINQVPTVATTLPASISNGVPFELPYEDTRYPYFIVGSAHVFSNPNFRRNLYYRTTSDIATGEKIYVTLEYFPSPISESSTIVDMVRSIVV